MKVLYIDTETTGRNPVKNDVIQISGFIEIDGIIKESFDLKCQPFSYENIEMEALAVNGQTVETLKTFETPRDTYNKFTKILGTYVNKFDRNDKFYVAGYNVRFDLDFLKSFFEKNNDVYFGSWFNWKCIDPLPILHFLEYQGKIKLDNYKLSTVCEYYKIELDAHDAANDILATREVIKYLAKL